MKYKYTREEITGLQGLDLLSCQSLKFCRSSASPVLVYPNFCCITCKKT